MATTSSPIQGFELTVRSTLTGVTLVEFEANIASFRAQVAALFSTSGIVADDIIITSYEEVSRRRRLLQQSSVAVDYKVTGFQTAEATAQAKSTMESSSAQLTTNLRSNGFAFLSDIQHQVQLPTSLDTTPAPTPPDEGSDEILGLSVPAFAGIVVGGALALCLLAGAVIVLHGRRKKTSRPDHVATAHSGLVFETPQPGSANAELFGSSPHQRATGGAPPQRTGSGRRLASGGARVSGSGRRLLDSHGEPLPHMAMAVTKRDSTGDPTVFV